MYLRSLLNWSLKHFSLSNSIIWFLPRFSLSQLLFSQKQLSSRHCDIFVMPVTASVNETHAWVSSVGPEATHCLPSSLTYVLKEGRGRKLSGPA